MVPFWTPCHGPNINVAKDIFYYLIERFLQSEAYLLNQVLFSISGTIKIIYLVITINLGYNFK